MEEFDIVRQMNELADKINNLYQVIARLKSSQKDNVLISVVVAKYEVMAFSFKNDSLVKAIEAEIHMMSLVYDDLKTQLINPKDNG